MRSKRAKLILFEMFGTTLEWKCVQQYNIHLNRNYVDRLKSS